jgi:hypothetical protein
MQILYLDLPSNMEIAEPEPEVPKDLVIGHKLFKIYF